MSSALGVSGLGLAGALQIVTYPYPTLRQVSKSLKRVDDELRQMVRRMFDLMYASNGVGLAANQVDLPYRLFVVNLKADPKAAPEFVFVNPVLSKRKGMSEAEEGCLSLPGVYAQVKRPERVTLDAYDLTGQAIHLELDGLFARVVQHEVDHLDGKLFIDRLSTTGELQVRESIADFELTFQGMRDRGELPGERAIAERLAELEKLRT